MSCEGITVEVYDKDGWPLLKAALRSFKTEGSSGRLGVAALGVAALRRHKPQASFQPLEEAVIYLTAPEEMIMVTARDFHHSQTNDFGFDAFEYIYSFRPRSVYNYKKEKEGWGCFRRRKEG